MSLFYKKHRKDFAASEAQEVFRKYDKEMTGQFCSKDFEGKIKVFKLNTDENPNVASQYGIRSIPTLMIFKGGQKVDTVVGAVPKATLSSTLTKHL